MWNDDFIMKFTMLKCTFSFICEQYMCPPTKTSNKHTNKNNFRVSLASIITEFIQQFIYKTIHMTNIFIFYHLQYFLLIRYTIILPIHVTYTCYINLIHIIPRFLLLCETLFKKNINVTCCGETGNKLDMTFNWF